MGDKHRWNNWNEYKSAHDGCMRHYLSFFVVKDELTFNYADEAIYVDGVLYCENGIEISVHKQLDVNKEKGRVMVRTVEYSYHIMRRLAGEVTNILRYDNIHLHKGHPDKHHKHIYNDAGEEVSIIHVGYDNWFTLAEVMEKAYQWNVQQTKSG